MSVLLSVVRRFDVWGLVVGLLLYLVCTAIHIYKAPSLRDRQLKSELKLWDYLTLFFSITITTVIIARSWGIIDITHDAIVYVLPRMHLFQQLHSFLYDTYSNIANIWYNQMNFEIIATTWDILTQSIFFNKITNQLFFFWGLVATYLLLQKVGLQKSLAFVGVVVIGLMPVNFLIAHTIKNDSALFAATLVSIYYFISFWQNNQKRSLLFFLLATLFCIGIKTTTLPLSLLLVAALLIKKRTIIGEIYLQTKTIYKLCILLLLLPIGLHRYIANLIHYGNALITVPEESVNLSFHTAVTALQNAFSAQYDYILSPSSALTINAMDNPLSANGGHIMMILFFIAIPGLLLLVKRTKLNKYLALTILVQTFIMIIIRPWYPWSTRYIMILLLLVTWASLYTLQIIKTRYPKLVIGVIVVSILITFAQTSELIQADHSFWLQNRFTNLGVLTRYDAITESQEISPTAKITFVANADVAIYQFIKPSNIIRFQQAESLTSILNTMLITGSEYLIITNLHQVLLNEAISSGSLTPIHLRNNLANPNNSNVFKLNLDG